MTWDDKPLPEDEAISAAHPMRTKRHHLYTEAMRLVGARHSKGGLVALVTWLLHRIENHEARTTDCTEPAEAAPMPSVDDDTCDYCEREAVSYNSGDRLCDEVRCHNAAREQQPKKVHKAVPSSGPTMCREDAIRLAGKYLDEHFGGDADQTDEDDLAALILRVRTDWPFTRKDSEGNRATKARLDTDRTAQPKTEIVGVYPEGNGRMQTVHLGQAESYVARPTVPRRERAELDAMAAELFDKLASLRWPPPMPDQVRDLIFSYLERARI